MFELWCEMMQHCEVAENAHGNDVYICLLCPTVQKPEKLSWVEAAGAIQDGVRAYTALHTLARMATGHTLLLLDGASVRVPYCLTQKYTNTTALLPQYNPHKLTLSHTLHTCIPYTQHTQTHMWQVPSHTLLNCCS